MQFRYTRTPLHTDTHFATCRALLYVCAFSAPFFFCITCLPVGFYVHCRSYCPSLSVVRVELTHQAVVCGGDFQSRFKKYWNHTLTAGIHIYSHVDTHIICYSYPLFSALSLLSFTFLILNPTLFIINNSITSTSPLLVSYLVCSSPPYLSSGIRAVRKT